MLLADSGSLDITISLIKLNSATNTSISSSVKVALDTSDSLSSIRQVISTGDLVILVGKSKSTDKYVVASCVISDSSVDCRSASMTDTVANKKYALVSRATRIVYFSDESKIAGVCNIAQSAENIEISSCQSLPLYFRDDCYPHHIEATRESGLSIKYKNLQKTQCRVEYYKIPKGESIIFKDLFSTPGDPALSFSNGIGVFRLKLVEFFNSTRKTGLLINSSQFDLGKNVIQAKYKGRSTLLSFTVWNSVESALKLLKHDLTLSINKGSSMEIPLSPSIL